MITIEEVSKSIAELEEENQRLKDSNSSWFTAGILTGIFVFASFGLLLGYVQFW